MSNPIDDSRFELLPGGRFRDRFGPLGEDAPSSSKKLCIVATDAALLVELLYGLSLRPDCFYVKYSTICRDGMYLGRCSLATDQAASELCQELKGHARLMVSLQDDAWFKQFRDEPIPDGSCGVWDDWSEHEAQVTAVVTSAFGRPDEANLVLALRAARAAPISLVAQIPPETRGREPWPIVGHIALSPVTVDGKREPRGLAIGSLAIAPAHQRQGFAARLMQAALRRARALGYDYLVVLGDPHYYSRFGFVPASQWGLSPPVPLGQSSFMALELVPDALANAHGTLRYHPAFSQLKII